MLQKIRQASLSVVRLLLIRLLKSRTVASSLAPPQPMVPVPTV
jgi:hypothetical protein